MVDNDTNRARLILANPSLFELEQRESTALAELRVVAHSLAVDSGTELLQGAHTEPCCLFLPRTAASELATRLVEPRPDAGLPVLVEVIIMKDVVVSETHVCERKRKESQ